MMMMMMMLIFAVIPNAKPAVHLFNLLKLMFTLSLHVRSTWFTVFMISVDVNQYLVISLVKVAPNSYGFIAQLVEHCTGIAEVTGSKPAEA